MSSRASIFGPSSDSASLDLEGFTPRPRKAPDTAAVRSVSEASDFPSRQGSRAADRTKVDRTMEPRTETAREPALRETFEARAEPPAEPRLRRRRTGRNIQINIKASKETIDSLYRLADENGWVLGETLEHAVAALTASLEGRKGRG